MGLMDVLNGMQNGPRGARGASGGGMSPITMALLGLLAYKAVKHFGAGSAQSSSNPSSTGGGQGAVPQGGGLGGLLAGLGLGGGSAGLGAGGTGAGGLGNVLSGGLNDLLRQFQDAGKGEFAASWVGSGENKPVAPQDLAKVLTPEQIEFLSQRTGMSRDELLANLSQHLPAAVDELTPKGRVPTPEEIDRA